MTNFSPTFLSFTAPQAPPAYSTPYTPPPQGGYQAPPPPAAHTSNTTVLIQPAHQTHRVVVDIKPPNYVVLSVITMIFFCWIFGLIALLSGMQVRTVPTRGCGHLG